MKLIVSTFEEFSSLFSNPEIVFNSASFAQLNRVKCHRIHYIVFRDSKVRLGIILGETHDMLLSPFSSPFGGFSQAVNATVRLQSLEEAISLLKLYASELGKKLTITLPPTIYNRDLISKTVSALARDGFTQDYIDLSYYIPVTDTDSYLGRLNRSAVKNLNSATNNNLTFYIADSDEDRRLAYDIIRINRESKGYPLRMSYDQIEDTASVIEVTYFIIKLDQKAIASALVFNVTDKISQVVYWGNIPEASDMRPMNFMPLKLVEHYHRIGVEILDIGPSTEFGVPNYGLCEFKSSIGCESDLKFKFTFNPLK
ncbi:MAG: hypothetical protein ACRCTF_05970 [Bacteroidales bacterium]